MSAMLMATDYSSPIRHLFEQAVQVGSVHSVFQRAMNIAFGETLLSILSDELPRMPNSVQLPALQAERLFAEAIPGMAAFVGNGNLSIPACDCWIALPSMGAWEPRPQLGLLQWKRDWVAHHADTLARYLAEVALEEGLAPLVGELLLGRASKMTVLTQRALPMLRLLMRASGERKREDVERAAMGLLGLGPGLTPSGDDVLAGFVAVMVLLSARLSVDGLSREEIGLWIATLAPSRTTRLSAALLAYAARGEVAEQLANVLIALASPVELSKAISEVVLNAADGLLQFGATSGGDTLLGVLLGLRVLEYVL